MLTLARYRDTLADLSAPRRAIPIVLFTIALAAGQLVFSPDAVALLLALLLVGAFVALAPYAWRRLFGAGRLAAPAPVRGALYVGLGLAATALFAWALPLALDRSDTFLAAPGSLLLEPALFCVGGWGLGRDIELARDPLAALVRDALDAARAATWPLARELEIVKSLCDVRRLRRPDAPRVTVSLEPAAAAIVVPSLALLPLTAVASSELARGEIGVAARARAGAVEIVVTGLAGASLEAARLRLEGALGERAAIGVEEVDGGARLVLTLAADVLRASASPR
ncbi:MAG: hypothetical protein IT385_10220 [Deltaproteobacteria bacterium]|nr:hypothetical protein [Deltaproteobacteria bacterium]